MRMINIAKSVAFTGHRPEKIAAGGQEDSARIQRIKQELREAVIGKIEAGCNCFLSGMAMGADLWAAEIVLELKQFYPQILLTAVIPFAGQADRFPEMWRRRYDTVLAGCDYVTVLSDSYYKGCFRARNQWLLDHSEHLIAVKYGNQMLGMIKHLIAVFNGSRGGTMQTLNDALLSGHRVVVIQC